MQLLEGTKACGASQTSLATESHGSGSVLSNQMTLEGRLALGIRGGLPLAAKAHHDVILPPSHHGLLVLLDSPPVSWSQQAVG